ncbi:MAG TPA: hypothetical protein VM557_04420, partial [Thermoanaerobaculia bacterium]|nr:hypothetical protein [Thermoanaerobaculia bacterium]
FRWTEVSGADHYVVYLSINGATPTPAAQVPASPTPEVEIVLPAGVTLGWLVETHFADADCLPTRSELISFEAGCFPPEPSVVGEVTSGNPYEVRATIISVASQYEFQESLTPDFSEILQTVRVTPEAGAEYVAAIFSHEVSFPTRYHYRTRILIETSCPFSPVASTVIIPVPGPTDSETDTTAQFGKEEEIRQQLFIPNPEPESGVSFLFEATTDRDWMRVEPSSGTIGPAGVTLTVITNPAGLPVGTNAGTVMLVFTPEAGKTAQSNHTRNSSVQISVNLVTPVTNKGKGSPSASSLIIPAVAHASGIDSEWQTDVRLINLSNATTKYTLNLTTSGQDGTISGKSAEVSLAPGQNAALDDIVKHWYGLGSIPGESATGVLEIRPLGAQGAGKTGTQVPVTKSLVSIASSRTYNRTPAGTLGQFIPAIPFSAFSSRPTDPEAARSVLSIQQLQQTEDYRTNVGLVEAAGKPVTVALRFFDEAGTEILAMPVELKAGEHRQLNQVLLEEGITLLSGRATVEITAGDGAVSAYASVVDNGTNDPLLVQGIDLATLGASRYVIPGVAHFNTGQNRWRSDVQLFNAGTTSQQATLAFFRQGETSAAKTVEISLGPGTMRTFGDVLPSVFGESNTGGVVQVLTSNSSSLVVTARTYDQTEAGTLGQFIPAVTEAQAIGMGDRAMQVLQMEESASIRSNLGVVEVSGKPVRIELTAHAAESRVTPRVELTLQPNEFRQLNQVLRALNIGTTYNARISLRVIGGDGKLAAYASAIDNKTQDPTYIPGQ